jgi:hypothetical protein
MTDASARLLLATLMLLAGAPCAAQAGLEMELRLSAQGRSGADRRSELEVRLLAPRAGTARLRVGDPQLLHVVRVSLRAGEPQRLWLPLRLPRREAVQVRAEFDGLPAVLKQVWPAPPSPRTLAVTAALVPATVADAAAGLSVLRLTRDALPRSVHGYAPLAALAVDGETLAQLTPRQARAFEQYLADCGTVLVAGLTLPELQPLRAGAGCAGAGVLEFVAGADLVALLANAPPRPTATGSALRTERTTTGEPSWPLPLLVGYAVLLCLLLVTASRLRLPLLLGAASVATVAVLLLGQGSAPRITRTVWQEQIGGNLRRVTTALALYGRGIGRSTVPLVAGSVLLEREGSVWLESPAAAQPGGEALRLVADTRMLSRASLRTEHRLRAQALLDLERSHDGWVLRNRTGTVTPAGLWLEPGRLLAVPALQPGEDRAVATLHTAAPPPTARSATALSSARDGLDADEVAVLLPLPSEQGEAWWLLRGGRSGAGG